MNSDSGADSDSSAASIAEDVEVVEISHDKSTAEADQFLDLSGADPEKSTGEEAPDGAE